jgi:hypothetical protein
MKNKKSNKKSEELKMTLVGIIVHNNSVIILSDILLSGNIRFFDPKPIPSIGNSNINGKTIFIENIEKIYMFSSKSLIGFAGNPFLAQKCINEISQLNDLCNLSKIDEIVRKYNEKDGFSCIYVLKDNKKTNLISTSEIFEDFSNFNYVSVIGSGSSTFLEYLRKIDANFNDYMFYTKKTDNLQQINQIELNILMVLQILSEFFKEDFVQHGKSLQNKFGGFYEITFEFQNHFRKLSDYTLCIWHYRNNKLELKYKFHPTYKGNGLTIHKVEFSGKIYSETEFYAKKLENYYQNLEKGDKSNNTNYHLDYDCTLNIIYTIKGNNVVSSIKYLIGTNSFENSINLKYKDGKVLEFTFSKGFSTQLSNLISLKKEGNQKAILESGRKDSI